MTKASTQPVGRSFLFREMDSDGDGLIDTDELKKHFSHRHGMPNADAKAEELMAGLDHDKDGKIDLKQWRKGTYLENPIMQDLGIMEAMRNPTGTSFNDLSEFERIVSAQDGHRLMGFVAPPEDELFQEFIDEDCRASRTGCSIPRVEERGITLHQLHAVWRHIERRCERERWVSFAGELLTPGTVTLYDACRYVIKPATAERQCSLVELMASGPQPPRWFVSHWWGEEICDFIACLEQHAADHCLDFHTPYWVCAYANNQHDLGNAVTAVSLLPIPDQSGEHDPRPKPDPSPRGTRHRLPPGPSAAPSHLRRRTRPPAPSSRPSTLPVAKYSPSSTGMEPRTRASGGPPPLFRLHPLLYTVRSTSPAHSLALPPRRSSPPPLPASGAASRSSMRFPCPSMTVHALPCPSRCCLEIFLALAGKEYEVYTAQQGCRA